MTLRNLPRPTFIRQLQHDSSGMTLVEFAFVGPVLILMIMGLFDIAHSQYTLSIVQGAIQKAGRDTSLQSGAASQATITNRVRTMVESVAPSNATVTVTPQNFFDFADVNKAETLTNDANNNGFCNAGDSYIDANNNGQWDRSGGGAGVGGARDVVLYTATVSYPRLFPMAGLAGLSNNVTITASTVLRNQPFDDQRARSTTVRTC